MSDHTAGDAVPEVDESRRKFLIAATAGTGAVGAVLTAVPFLASWNPSESARAAGLPTEVDLSKMEPGQMTTHFWRKKQIYVVKRTPEMLASLAGHDGELKDKDSAESKQPAYAKNEDRSWTGCAQREAARRHVQASSCSSIPASRRRWSA